MVNVESGCYLVVVEGFIDRWTGTDVVGRVGTEMKKRKCQVSEDLLLRKIDAFLI